MGTNSCKGMAAALVGIFLIACGSFATLGTKGDPPAKPAVKPGFAVGRVLTVDGKAITAPNAQVQLAIHGTGNKSGQRLEYKATVRPDGSYEQKLADGEFHFFAAFVKVPLEGKTFLLDLEPVGDDRADRDSVQGFVQEYVWKIKGARPGKGDENKPGDWYGASLMLSYDRYRNDIRKPVPAPAKDAKFVFTLTPKSKLIDGSDGKELTFTRDYDPLLGSLKNGYLPDVPIGIYMIKGEETGPDGKKVALLFRRGNNPYSESMEIRFEPDGVGTTRPIFGFTRPVK